MGTRYSKFALALAMSAFAVSAWAKTTTLTVVDGQKWSAGTWDNGLPENGDIVVVSNGTAAAAATVNDLVTTLTRIDFKGLDAASTLTLEGNNLSLSGDTATKTDKFATALWATVKVTVDVELTATDSSCWYCQGSACAGSGFKQDVFIANGKTLLMKTSWDASGCYFSKRIVGPNATFDPRAYHTTLDFNGPIDIGTLDGKSQGNYSTLNFYATGNKIGTFLNYGDNVNVLVADAFATPIVLQHDTVMDNQAAYGFHGEQVLKGFSGPNTVNRGFRVSSYYTGECPLTLKPTADYSAPVVLGGSSLYNQLSITYAPDGDYTQTIIGREHPMPGPLWIKGGTFRVTGDTRFTSLATLKVEGGTFATASTSATTQFPALTSLLIGATGTFSVEDACTATVFDAGKVDLQLASGGKISVPTGKTLSLKSVACDGKQLAFDTTYTSATADWIEGGGSVVVAAAAANTDYWTNAVSGTWSDGTKWSSGAAPAATDTAYVTAAGANFTVSVPSSATKPTAAIVRNDGTHVTTVDFTDGVVPSGLALSLGNGAKIADLASDETLTLNAGSLTLEQGGGFKVASGATLTWNSSGTMKVRDNAWFESAGELNLYTLQAGSVGTPIAAAACTSVVAITGGKVSCNGDFVAGFGGRIEVSGTTVITNLNASGCYLVTRGGVIDISGHAVVDNGPLWSSVFMDYGSGSGTVTLREYARWTGNTFYDSPGVKHNGSRIYWGGSGSITFRDHASFDLPFATEWRIQAGSVTFTYDSDATSSSNVRLDMSIPAGSTSGGNHKAYFKKGLVKLDNGLHIGGYAAYNKDGTASGSSRVYVDGGAISLYGNHDSWRYFSTCSLCLADGTHNNAATDRTPSVEGYLYLNSGAVTNRQGAVRLGCGRGLAAIVQTGGEFVNLETESSDRCPMAIGTFNATGSYTLQNGTFLSKSDVYVGGANMSQIGGKLDSWQDQGFLNLHDANGALTVAAADSAKPCSFTTEKNLYVGADGNGVLNLGEAGEINVGNATFYNGSVGDTNHTSVVNVTLGAAGAACLTASDMVTVQPGTKLVVDASKYAGNSRIWIVRAGELRGSFDVTVVGGKMSDGIVQTAKGVCYRRKYGLGVVVR